MGSDAFVGCPPKLRGVGKGAIVGARILGPLEVVDGDRPVKIGGPREQIMLAMLAQRANRLTSVDQAGVQAGRRNLVTQT